MKITPMEINTDKRLFQNHTIRSLSTTIQSGQCYLCQRQHLIYSYKQFLELSAKERVQEVKKLKLCMNCLRNDHFVIDCRSSSCRQCGDRHNTLCHFAREASGSQMESGRRPGSSSTGSSAGRSAAATDSSQGSSSHAESASGPSVHHMAGESERKRVLMSTALFSRCTRKTR